MLEGGKTKSLLHSQRWVYGKDYSDIVKSVKGQTSHHHALIKYAGLKGFNPSVVEDSLVPSLVDLALSLIPHPSRILLSAGNRHYTLGVNKSGHLSLIHPDTNLPYPVLQAHRGWGDMNLPKGFKDSSALRKQWKRVGEFVRSNEDMSHQEKMKSIILLEPVGYLANEHFQTLRIDLSNELLIETLQKFMEEEILKNAPKDDFPYTLHRHFFRDEDMMNSLHTLHQKVETHSAMIEDLYPQTMKSWEKEMLVHGTLGYLLHNEIIDRLSEKLKDRFDVFSNTLRQIKF